MIWEINSQMLWTPFSIQFHTFFAILLWYEILVFKNGIHIYLLLSPIYYIHISGISRIFHVIDEFLSEFLMHRYTERLKPETDMHYEYKCTINLPCRPCTRVNLRAHYYCFWYQCGTSIYSLVGKYVWVNTMRAFILNQQICKKLLCFYRKILTYIHTSSSSNGYYLRFFMENHMFSLKSKIWGLHIY